MKNPFEEAKPVSKKLKILLFGPSGSGKTLAALSFPSVAVVDSESGTDLYAGRPGVPKFDILRAKSLSDLENAVAFIKQDNGRTYDTLVIDPISVFYDVQKQAAEKQSKHGALGYQEWGKINNRMKYLYTELTNLPVHVVVLARESIEYTTKGGNLEKVGVKPDSDKALLYIFDFVVHMNPDHSGDVIKSRGVALGTNGYLDKVDWSVFEPIAMPYQSGSTLTYESEDAAAERDMQHDANDMRDVDVARAFFNGWKDKGISQSDILAALNVSRLSEWVQGVDAANQAVDSYIAKKALGNWDIPRRFPGPNLTNWIHNFLKSLKPQPQDVSTHHVSKVLKTLIADGIIPPDANHEKHVAWEAMVYLATRSKTQAWLLDRNAVDMAIAGVLNADELPVTPAQWYDAGKSGQDLWTLLTGLYDEKLHGSVSPVTPDFSATGTEG